MGPFPCLGHGSAEKICWTGAAVYCGQPEFDVIGEAMTGIVLRRGHVIDPVQGINGICDVAVAGGRISAVGAELSVQGKARVVDVSGALVVPGLVDIHTHVYPGVSSLGLDPDEVCLGNGVTAAVDAGSCGSDSFAAFKRWVADVARTRLFAFLNLSTLGLAGSDRVGELLNPAYIDEEGTLDILRKHPQVAIGIKIRVSASVTGGPSAHVMERARRVADEARVPIMVHIGDSTETMPQILSWLRTGDIVTHCLTWRRNGLMDADGRILPEVLEARERGVLFDPAHGVTHFSFEAAERLLDQGFPPDTISTDLSNHRGYYPANSMPAVIAKFMALGLPLTEVVRLSSSRPAEVLGRASELGSLEAGRPADVAVFRWEEGEFVLTDAVGQTRRVDRRLVPHLTLRNGEIVLPAGSA
jgi:dihydroorotase